MNHARLEQAALSHQDGTWHRPILLPPHRSRSERVAEAAAWTVNALFGTASFFVIVGLVRTFDAPWILFAYPFVMGAWLCRNERMRIPRKRGEHEQ